MKNRNSSFATIGGIIFLTVLVIYTNTMGFQKISGFLLFFLILFLCSFLWGKAALKKVRIQLQREDLTAFPGEPIPIRLTLENKKILPVTWMDILFPLPLHKCIWSSDEESIAFHEEADLTYQIPVFSRKISWVFPFQKIEWAFTLEARGRGVHHMDTLYLESGDGFGLSVISRKIPLAYPKQITVYPARIPVDTAPLLHQSTTEARGKQGYQEDITLLKNSRAYQYGDSFRRINWRLLARQQELMVNEYEVLSPQCMGFYIDLQSFVTFEKERLTSGTEMLMPTLQREKMEAMLSLVGSCILELTARQISCAVFIPGYENEEVRCCFGSDLEYQVPQLLEELAMIHYEAAPDTWKTRVLPTDLRPYRSRLGQIYTVGMCSEKLHTEALAEAFGMHRISYITYEDCEEDQRLERPLYRYSELSFAGKEED